MPNAARTHTWSSVDGIARRLRDVEADLSREARAQQRRWHFRLRRGRIRFGREVRQAHRRFRQSIPAFIREASLLNLLTTPIIYTLVVPFLLLDLWVTLYQWICFPIYGLARVRRGAYFAIDRHTLAYLNGIEKINCTYCSYANGVLAYVREIAARTEHYWCPIKHARAIRAPHTRYHLFFDFGDASAYRHQLTQARQTLQPRRLERAVASRRQVR